MCGECGIAKRTISVSNDDLIASGFGGMSLGTAQKQLFDAIREELDNVQENRLQKEHLVELLDEDIKSEATKRAILCQV